ncbi:cytochrome c [Cohnella sp. REN36]|uniref:c-type cytochrome n=1 Tax=Cohnella sp. REN36 TaxID=2887347 RepID=UPI001D13CBC7|nr:cytochrome c [Cohnella sp. REN36]MCC3374832.1 cytochrome c [Cohnella sp. REN36]
MQKDPIIPRGPRRAKTASFILLAAFALSLTACGGSGGGKGGASGSPAPLDGPKDTVALYRNNCISCHGGELQGKMGPDSDLRQVGARLDQDQIRRQIAEGGSLMPAFGQRLKTEEIDALAAWLAARK